MAARWRGDGRRVAARRWEHGIGGIGDVLAYLLPSLLAILNGAAIWTIRRTAGSALRSAPSAAGKSWRQLRRLRLGQLSNMLNLRATSLLASTSSVFMKRIRSLVSHRTFSARRYRIVANDIYDLQNSEPLGERLADLGVAAPGPQLQAVVEAAARMPTPLWFDTRAPWQQPSLVASGQANLI